MAIDPFVTAAIAELFKMGLMFLISKARQAGLNETLIEKSFQEAKASMLLNDPNKIPD